MTLTLLQAKSKDIFYKRENHKMEYKTVKALKFYYQCNKNYLMSTHTYLQTQNPTQTKGHQNDIKTLNFTVSNL